MLLRALPFLGCLFLATAAMAQDGEPRLPQHGSLRPLQTADAARGWEAIGRLDTGISFCSATLIAPELVLTAAHCLFGPDGAQIPHANLVFSASLRNGRAEAYRNIARSFLAEGYTRPDDAATFNSVSDDLALLELAHPISTSNIRPIPTGPRGVVNDLVTVVSYGRDREAFASIEEDCRILAGHDPVQVLSCTVVSGSSGAPILRQSGSGAEVIGVVSASGSWGDDDAGVAIAVDSLLPPLMAAYEASRGGVFDRTPGTIRRLTVGNDTRTGIGARFLRP